MADARAAERPVVVATTSILGDVVENLMGTQFDVVTIMPVGADPHDFQPSAKDVAALEGASAIVVNGAAFEEGLLDAIEAAAGNGALVFEAIRMITALEASPSSHSDHDDGDHDGDDGDGNHDGDDHDVDPHFFTDPARMTVVANGLVDFLVTNVDTIDGAALRAGAASYIEVLESLDTEVEFILAAVPDSRRVLVTSHQVFGYFADRYGFQVIGTVVPTGSAAEGASRQRLADLAELLKREGVSVVFADTSSPAELTNTLANEVGRRGRDRTVLRISGWPRIRWRNLRRHGPK